MVERLSYTQLVRSSNLFSCIKADFQPKVSLFCVPAVVENPEQNRYTPVFAYRRLSRRRLAEAGGLQRTRGAADLLFPTFSLLFASVMVVTLKTVPLLSIG